MNERTSTHQSLSGALETASDHIQSLLSKCSSRTASHADLLNLRLLAADLGIDIPRPTDPSDNRTRVAIVSLLFNWPSTGGGIVHTFELAKFLTEAGYFVKHIFAAHDQWKIGEVDGALPYSNEALYFAEQEWNPATIRIRFRAVVENFSPDCVIVTDSWNTKPLLAEAVSDFPYFIRLAAMECLCPLNNVRLIPDKTGRPVQCHLTQLATRQDCLQCVESNIRSSGWLHSVERQLAEFDLPVYDTRLRRAFSNSEGVLVVNSKIASLVEPYSAAVHVIPSGFDTSRFEDLRESPLESPTFRLLFAGLQDEYMKGFHVLLEASRKLWMRRQDFEVWVTSDGSDCSDPFIRFIGWQSQESLPQRMAECDAVVVPTIAQEALGRTAVEAMGAGRAVIASRIGGLSETVFDGFTGVLVEPSDAADLLRGIERLMNDRVLTKELGANGRKHFLATYPWEAIIERKYRPLFETCARKK